MYIFGALGYGAILAAAHTVSDGMVEASALALANSLNDEEKAAGLLYPRLDRIRETSEFVAAGVIRQAQKEKLDRNEQIRDMSDDQLAEYVRPLPFFCYAPR